ncbi:MAG: hypothetical protein DRP79_09245 [Planctomycetota bacterium]|nr:MAG: hypothetical protein DRP79_09245 [Planctomycetota bacterium]
MFCTEPDTCNNGVCSGPPHDCSDLNDACHDGVCDEESDSCVARQKQDGTACDDGLFCTVPDSCRSGSCTGPVRDCHDDDDCTQDVCDESEGTCLHVPQENPGAEGPAGSASCGNGIDDDCDGLTDTTDPDCVDSCGLRFDGVDDFVRVAQDRSILSSQQFGVLLDFTTGPMLTDWAVAAAQSGYSDDYPHNRWIVGFDPHDQRGLYLQVSNGEELLTLRDLVPLAECYNTRFVVLAVVNAASGHSRVWRYYQDSEQLLVDDDTFTGNINSVNVTYDLIVGDVANGNSPGTVFNATFREVAVFNYSEFTESDRQMLYTEPLKLKDYLLNGTDHGFSFPRSAVIDYLDFDVCNGSVLPNLGDPADGDGQLENFPSDGSQWIAE